MANLVKDIRLICVEQGSDQNHNKWWTGELYDNGDVKTRWGRVGGGEQSKTFPGVGESFLLKKAAEKQRGKKGAADSVYTPLLTVAASAAPQTVAVTGDLLDIARKQIKTNSPLLDKLIDMLVKENIHSITKSTQINYNAATGLFTTPLGIVTLDGISEGRKILAACADYVEKKKWGKELEKEVCKFLRIVPQDFGMKRLNVETFLLDLKAIQSQNDILDSLESSYQALQTPAAADPNAVAKPVESVFNVSLGLLQDQKEYDRILKKYKDTRKDMHVCAHLKVKNVYVVEIESNAKAFEVGKKLGNIHELWHGTKKANLLSILKSGLHVSPPSTARIAGKMFGNGVYFAHDSTKSLNYSFGYWDGKKEPNCFMFIADVAMGKYYVPAGAYESLPKANFDSTWAQGRKSGVHNDEYIVYSDTQFRLKYLVEFE